MLYQVSQDRKEQVMWQKTAKGPQFKSSSLWNSSTQPQAFLCHLPIRATIKTSFWLCMWKTVVHLLSVFICSKQDPHLPGLPLPAAARYAECPPLS